MIVMYSLCTVQYKTVQYSNVKYSTKQYSSVMYSNVKYALHWCTVLYCAVQCSVILYSTTHSKVQVPDSAIMYSTVQLKTKRSRVQFRLTIAPILYTNSYTNLCVNTVCMYLSQTYLQCIILGGYNKANAARCWAKITAMILNTELADDIPEHDVIYGNKNFALVFINDVFRCLHSTVQDTV